MSQQRLTCQSAWLSGVSSGFGAELLRATGCVFAHPLRAYHALDHRTFRGLLVDAPAQSGAVLLRIPLKSCVASTPNGRRAGPNSIAPLYHAAARTLSRSLLRHLHVCVDPVSHESREKLEEPVGPSEVELTAGLMLASTVYHATCSALTGDSIPEALSRMLEIGSRLDDGESAAMWQLGDETDVESAMWQQAFYAAFEEASIADITHRTWDRELARRSVGQGTPQSLSPDVDGKELAECLVNEATWTLFPMTAVSGAGSVHDDAEASRSQYIALITDAVHWGFHVARRRTFLTPVAQRHESSDLYAPLIDMVRPVKPTDSPTVSVFIDTASDSVVVKTARSLRAGEEVTRPLYVDGATARQRRVSAAVKYGLL